MMSFESLMGYPRKGNNGDDAYTKQSDKSSDQMAPVNPVGRDLIPSLFLLLSRPHLPQKSYPFPSFLFSPRPPSVTRFSVSPTSSQSVRR
jgi:hypothetical protein